MPYKDPEKEKAYKKEYNQKHKQKKKEYMKEYRKNNKENQKEYKKKYNQTPQGKKSKRIRDWKYRGILFHDYDLLYDIYLSTTHCYFCKCELNQCGSSRKCVDHNHDIYDNENVRNIVCSNCNLNIIK